MFRSNKSVSQKANIKVNLAYNVLYQILEMILPLITAPYVSRVLGSHNVGVYSFTNAAANYFYLFAMLGVMNYGNRTIAAVRDNKAELRKSFWEIYSLQSILAIIVSAVYIGYIGLFIKEDKLIYVMQFFYVASAIFNVNWACFGLEKFKLTATRSIIVRIAMTVAIFIYVKDISDLWIYTFILAVGSFVSCVTVWPLILKYIPYMKPSVQGVVRHLKPNLVLFWPVIAVSLYNIMDKLMLGWMSTKEEVGFYTYAERITQIPNTLILALDNVIMPRMSNLYAKDHSNEANRLMDKVMLFAMFMAAAMAFGLAAVAPVFAPWFYGEAFTRCGLFIVLLCPIIVFKGWAGALRTQYIIPKHKDSIYIISLTSGAAVNLIVNSLLIPKWNGVGAIIGTIAAEFSVAFIQFFMCRKEINLKQYLVDGLGFCLIGVCMYLVVTRLTGLGKNVLLTLGFQVIVGVVIYIVIAAVFLLKVRRKSDVINLFHKIFKRGGSR